MILFSAFFIHVGSLVPVAVVADEVAQHVEGRLRLVGGHEVAGLVDQHEPQVAVGLGPAFDLLVDHPDLLAGALPVGDAGPPQAVEVVEHACCIDHVVLLSVVDEHLDASQQDHDIRSVGHRDILVEAIVDCIVSWDVADLLRNAQTASVGLQEVSKRPISVLVLPEVELVHSAHVRVPSGLVVSQIIPKGGGLSKEWLTFPYFSL